MAEEVCFRRSCEDVRQEGDTLHDQQRSAAGQELCQAVGRRCSGRHLFGTRGVSRGVVAKESDGTEEENLTVTHASGTSARDEHRAGFYACLLSWLHPHDNPREGQVNVKC